jgi:hypothetical protein
VEAVRRPGTRDQGDLATVAEMDVGFTLAIGSKNIASDSVRRWVTGMQQYEGSTECVECAMSPDGQRHGVYGERADESAVWR